MLNSLYRTAWTIGGGLVATGAITALAYYVEAKDLRASALRAADEQINRAENALYSARTEAYAASALIGESHPSIATVRDFLPGIVTRRPDQGLWLWAQVVPRGEVPAVETAIRRQTGDAGYRVHGGSDAVAAPIIFTSGVALAGKLGLDLNSVAPFAQALRPAPGPQVSNLADVVVAPGGDFIGGPVLFIGTAVNHGMSGNPLSRSLLMKGITLENFTGLARISDGQGFALTGLDGAGERLIFTSRRAVAAGAPSRDLSFGPYQLRLTIAPADGARPRNWPIIALAGLLATGLAAMVRAWADLGGRANSLSDALSTAAAELTDVRGKELAFFENSGTANCETEYATGRLLRVNEVMCRLLGYDRSELIGRQFSEIIHPEDLPLHYAALFDEHGQPRPLVQFEKRYVKKNGTAVWCLVNGRLITDRSGQPVAHARVIIDITKRKQDEATQAMLLSELAHRVRNTVQLTSSLARQSAHNARSVKDYEAKFHGRLAALKAAQDLLFDSGWKSASLPDLARSTLKPYNPPKEESSRLTVDLPPVELPTQHAQTLGIAMNELAANAAKYGALAHGGRISLTGRLDAAEDGGRLLYLRWEETGLTSLHAPRRTGFGTTMLKVAVPEQFQGRARLTWARTGLIYEAWLPLDGMVPPPDSLTG